VNRRNLIKNGGIWAALGSFFGFKQKTQAANVKIVPVLYTHPEPMTHTGFDGTHFALEPLARVRDSREYLLKAYTIESVTPPFNGRYVYKRLEYTGIEMARFGWHPEELHAELKNQFDQFVSDFYAGKLIANGQELVTP
jgi:hypothetical protein